MNNAFGQEIVCGQCCVCGIRQTYEGRIITVVILVNRVIYDFNMGTSAFEKCHIICFSPSRAIIATIPCHTMEPLLCVSTWYTLLPKLFLGTSMVFSGMLVYVVSQFSYKPFDAGKIKPSLDCVTRVGWNTKLHQETTEETCCTTMYVPVPCMLA